MRIPFLQTPNKPFPRRKTKAGYWHRAYCPPFWLRSLSRWRLELELLAATAGLCTKAEVTKEFRHDTSRQKQSWRSGSFALKFQEKWCEQGADPCVYWKRRLQLSSCKAVAMFYVPSGTPSTGSSDSVDGALSSRNLAGLLDEQRKKGIGAGLLTITGKTVRLFLNNLSAIFIWLMTWRFSQCSYHFFRNQFDITRYAFSLVKHFFIFTN